MQQTLSKAQREAFINEYKGNLLEFGVAYELAQKNGLSASFLTALSQGYRQQLADYERCLREWDPELHRKLPVLSKALSQCLESSFKRPLDEVVLVGKDSDYKQAQADEADIIVRMSMEKRLLSLKLCRLGSFVNTKSGGVSSFFRKYFDYPQKHIVQAEWNHWIEAGFQEMAEKLHQHYALNYTGDFKLWQKENLPRLPGELDQTAKNYLLDYYHHVISKAYEYTQRFFEQDRSLFAKSLWPLCGFSQASILQVFCLYKNTPAERYQIEKIRLWSLTELEEKMSNCRLMAPKEGQSSFHIQLDDVKFQIRVKPMNTFMVKSLKVNCSVCIDV